MDAITTGLLAEFDQTISDAATLAIAADMLSKSIASKRDNIARIVDDLRTHAQHIANGQAIIGDMVDYLAGTETAPLEIAQEQVKEAA